MQEQTVNPTLGWSWSGLALGPIALIKHGLWRVFLISMGTLVTIFAIATAAALIPQVPMRRELLPLIGVVLLILYHFLVASSLSRWRMHRYLHERLARQGGLVTSTGIAGQRLQSDLALMRHRAETTLETDTNDSVDAKLLAISAQSSTEGQPMSATSAHGLSAIANTDTRANKRPEPADTEDFEDIPDHLFAQALDELRPKDSANSFRRDETAWHQATTIHGDNLDLARSFYIRIRVKQLLQSNPRPALEITPAHNLQRANSRRMARLRAYESYIEKVFKNATPATAAATLGGPVVVTASPAQLHDHSTLTIAQINALLLRAGLSLSTTQASGYIVHNSRQDAMEMGSHQELEQFLQILAQIMTKYGVERQHD